MTGLLVVLIALALAVAGSLFFMDDPGYVLITLDPWSLEISVATLVVVLALVFLVLYFVIRVLVRLWNSPRDIRRARRRRQATKASQSRDRGMLELIEGDAARAERHLLSHLPHAGNQVLNLIGAAHAAQSQGKLEARDRYLQQARQAEAGHSVEIDLTHAMLQYRAGEYEPALDTLLPLLERKPKNSKILGLTVKTCEALEDWPRLLEILPAARKHKALPEQELERLDKLASLRTLHGTEPDRLEQEWKRLPRASQSDTDLLTAYAERQIRAGRMDEAESLLRKAINRSWQPAGVKLYGRVTSSNLPLQLKRAQKWATQHPDDPDLLLTLARICMSLESWSKARSYLEACIGAGGSAEAHQELGRLLEQLDDPDAALAYYRDGLKKAVPGEGTPRQLTHLKPET